MNVVELAKEAGFFEFNIEGWSKEFEKFAALVRAEALEEAFLVCQQISMRYLENYAPDKCAAAIRRLK